MMLMSGVAPHLAHADVEPVGLPVPRRARRQDVVIDIPGERTTNNKLLLAGIGGAALIAGAIGTYFTLDWKSASDDVAASQPTGEAWTPRHVELVARADRSAGRAGIAYGIGGAFLLGAIVTYIATEPKSTRQIIPTRAPTVTPTQGGMMLGKMWSF
ncbi:MAG: hypothetical protein KF773_03785 [Deltaproteobacteria bacterium]|nr:hypothetical protein [Deltaproteobacteria bacterium]